MELVEQPLQLIEDGYTHVHQTALSTRAAISLSLACAAFFYIVADRMGAPAIVSVITGIAGFVVIRAIYSWLVK